MRPVSVDSEVETVELWLRAGDYVPDGRGGLVRLEGGEAVLQRVLFRLCARRGGFPLLPEMGSGLYRLGSEPRISRLSAARQYVAEALRSEDVSVEDVSLREAGGGRMDVEVSLLYQGERLLLHVVV